MRATAFEVRFRVPIHATLLALALWAPGLRTADSASVWMLAAGNIAHQRWLTIEQASFVIGYSAAVSVLLAAVLCTWADSRASRTASALGVELHAIALAILMPLYGAIFAILAVGIFTLRLHAAPPLNFADSRERALLNNIYLWGAAASFLLLVPKFNSLRIIQGILLSAGLALIIRGLIPTPELSKQAANHNPERQSS